ncbi:MAG: hypothetical protein ABSB96_02160 [Gaiellaceae bacterium]
MTRHGDSLLAERLSALEDPRDDSDWEDVLRRALEQPLERSRRFRGRRALLIAAAIAVLMLALGVALAATLGGFSGWLSGKPGSPASPTEQSAFQQANARSWAAFPTGTKLRRLIVTRSEGSTYRLFGFRSGDEICLRLTVDGADRGALMSCIPRLELVKAKAPAAVALVDAPAGKARYELTGRRIGGSRQRVRIRSGLVSFGVTADGVSIVELLYGRHRGRARVANNAFLYIRSNHPYAGVTIDRISAGESGNHLTAVPFAGRPYEPFTSHPSMNVPFGPSRVDLNPPLRSIEWIRHHEPRGLSLAQAHIPRSSLYGAHSYGINFARVIQPDPRNHVRVVMTQVGRRNALCENWIVGARAVTGGCFGFENGRLFSAGYAIPGGEESGAVSGIANDAVARLDIFLNDGERWPVPLKDNAYVILVPRILLPAKLVAYDAQNRVIGIQTLPGI